MTAVEHPAVRVRALALARLGRQFPSRCIADREDAVHEALCAALEHGHAGQVRTVSGWAARRLLGVTRERGALRSARSPATSTAGRAFSDPDGEQVDPADWLDASARVAITVEPEAALDLERWQGRDWTAEVRRLVGEARAQGLRWCDIAQACGVVTTAPIRWGDGSSPPKDPEAAAIALDDLLRDRAAMGARIRAEADARVLRVQAARLALERRERAADVTRLRCSPDAEPQAEAARHQRCAPCARRCSAARMTRSARLWACRRAPLIGGAQATLPREPNTCAGCARWRLMVLPTRTVGRRERLSGRPATRVAGRTAAPLRGAWCA
jgi:hypothetical protein